MKHAMMSAIAAIALMAASPAEADSVPASGVTYEQIIAILTKQGLPARIEKDSKGIKIIKSTIGGINFDVYFFNCTDDERCREIQFAAGWTKSKRAAATINSWNHTKRRIRVYSMPDDILYAEQDAAVANGTTENIEYCLRIWATSIAEFKTFMKL